ncbi:MIOX, partial [Symbiodinium natans]
HCYNPEIQKMNDIDTCAVMFKYENGMLAMVDTSRDAAYGYDQRIEVFGEKGMLTAHNELTSTVELATTEGHLRPAAMYSFPQRYVQAYHSELTEFIELVRAGRGSEAHALEQVAMLRHPSVVRATLAAELSWKLKRTVQLAELDKLCAAGSSSSETDSPGNGPVKNMFGDSFRNYETSPRQESVAATYGLMHRNQTVEFVQEQQEKWLKFNKGEFTVMEVITMLDELVDDSDPDVDIPNSIHDFQTAERIREQWPGEEFDWFHLVGLLHDLGKVMALPKLAGKDALPQWAVVGDTFPVGCAPAEDAVVFPEAFHDNPDYKHPVFGTKNGMYKPGCGITKLMFSWGHDEYMYRMLKFNGCTIPEHGLNMIRLHSFYPWHDKGAYAQFESSEDAETKKWVKEKLKPYYACLWRRWYCPVISLWLVLV